MPELDASLLDLFRARKVGTLATLKRDGRPQLSNVLFHLDQAGRSIRISVTDSRAKTRNVRRDPRVSLHVASKDGWSYAVAEGRAALSAVAAEPDDDVVDELVEMYRLASGEHPDWDEYRRAMVTDRRLVLTINIERVYGLRQDG
jgi:PPOX class probable F420-dependent enzyme